MQQQRGGEGMGAHCTLAEGTRHTGVRDLSVFTQQAHVGLNKGVIFFLHVGRVSVGPALQTPWLPAACPSARAVQPTTPADLHVAHRWVRGLLWPVRELLVARGLGIEQVGQRAQLEVVPVWRQV